MVANKETVIIVVLSAIHPFADVVDVSGLCFRALFRSDSHYPKADLGQFHFCKLLPCLTPLSVHIVVVYSAGYIVISFKEIEFITD